MLVLELLEKRDLSEGALGKPCTESVDESVTENQGERACACMNVCNGRVYVCAMCMCARRTTGFISHLDFLQSHNLLRFHIPCTIWDGAKYTRISLTAGYRWRQPTVLSSQEKNWGHTNNAVGAFANSIKPVNEFGCWSVSIKLPHPNTIHAVFHDEQS